MAEKPAGDKTKSRYLDQSQKILDRLNAVSPSMCLAKWYNVSIHLTTGRTHSCYHPPSHPVPLDELAADPGALHNTAYKKEQRAQMLRGERPTECRYCWRIEDAAGEQKHFSDRAYRSADVDEPGLLEEAIRLGAEGHPIPRYVEVNFNQSCNFKCSYCSPHLSTTWMKEIKEHGPYALTGHRGHNDLAGLQEAGLMPNLEKSKIYVEAFWKWWPELYPHLRHFRMTGGEPLMDVNTFRVFDYVTKNPKADLQLAITSNCCPPPAQWDRFLEDVRGMERAGAFQRFTLFCSLDSWGNRAEYIRHGMDFGVLRANIRRFLESTGNTHLTFIATFNNLSVTGWMDYLKWILELREEFSIHQQRIWFDTPMLHAPRWMSLKILPDTYIETIDQSIRFVADRLETPARKFKGFKDFELDRLQRLKDFMLEREPADTIEKDRADFARYFKEHDRRRGTDLYRTFPEMVDFFELCARAAAHCD